jgi:hypothetical protein
VKTAKPWILKVPVSELSDMEERAESRIVRLKTET